MSAALPGDAVLASPRTDLDELADDVLAIAGPPIDAWAVAATLESRGVRDSDAVGRFGCDDVFALAERVFRRCGERFEPVPLLPTPDAPFATRLREFTRFYARGAFFFVSMALQVAALSVFGYGQWASLQFTLTQVSVVALAAGASFVATAGAVQALGHLGPRYREPGKGLLTERLAWWCLAVAALLVIAVGGALVGVNALVGAPYSADLVTVGLVYYGLLAALWLVGGLLYLLHAYAAMTLSTVVGLGCVVLLRSGAGLGIYAAQWLALGVSAAVGLGWAAVVLRRDARRTGDELRVARFEPWRLLARSATPAFWFGTLYFAFVLCDRLVAWSAGDHPLPLWFDVSYELGLDLALVAVVPALAFLEPTIETFSDRVMSAQPRFAAGAVRSYNRAMTRFHLRRLAAAAAIALLGVAVAVLAVAALDAAGALGSLTAYAHGTVSPYVFAWGAAGYVLLSCGLLSASVLMALGRPLPVVGALVAAIAVDAAVGIALTRSGPMREAAVGLAAGGATFALLTTLMAVRTLRRSDYRVLATY